ncbi:hypothetical protein N9411_00710 [bacterium]|nr:hypothetical protein [bacterium]
MSSRIHRTAELYVPIRSTEPLLAAGSVLGSVADPTTFDPGDFFAGDFFAGDFFTEGVFAEGVFAEGFLATVLLATGFLPDDFGGDALAATTSFIVVFLTVVFLVVVFDVLALAFGVTEAVSAILAPSSPDVRSEGVVLPEGCFPEGAPPPRRVFFVGIPRV